MPYVHNNVRAKTYASYDTSFYFTGQSQQYFENGWIDIDTSGCETYVYLRTATTKMGPTVFSNPVTEQFSKALSLPIMKTYLTMTAPKTCN